MTRLYKKGIEKLINVKMVFMKKLKILICGASGFIGTHLIKDLVQDGHEIVYLTRNHLKNMDRLCLLVDGVDGIINLCGAPLLRRWSEEYKKEIYESRVLTTKILVDACFLVKKAPKFFISASSVSIYTNIGIHDENSEYYGIDYLSFLTKDWENEANRIKDLGVRVVISRMGAVLGNGGGVLEELKRSVGLGICAIPGDGKQGFPWICIDDLVSFFRLAVKDEQIHGIYNLVSPDRIDTNTFFKAFGKVLKRPVWRYAPVEILKVRYKDGYEVLTKTVYAKPKKLLDMGFEYKCKEVSDIFSTLVL